MTFEVLDEKGLKVVVNIPETQVELVVMSAIFKFTLVVNHDGSLEISSMWEQSSSTESKPAEIK